MNKNNIELSRNFLNSIYGNIDFRFIKRDKWSLNEIKTFITIIYKIQKKQSLDIKLDLSDFDKKLSDNNHFLYMNKILNSIKSKNFFMKIDKETYRNYSLFSHLEYNQKSDGIIVSFNPNLKKEVFNIESFSKIELKNIISCNSYYSLRARLLLSSMNHLKSYIIDIERFKILFQIPPGYKNKHIIEKVFNVIINDLEEVENINFKYTGRKATHVIFNYNFKNIDSNEIIEAEIVEDGNLLEKAILKAKKNIYVSKTWNKRTDIKIEKIEKEYGLNFTIKILNELYINLKQDVKTTLVQYINGIVNNINEPKEEVKKEPPKKKVTEKKEKKIVEKTKAVLIKQEIKISDEEISKAIKKCAKAENLTESFLLGLRKKSENIFMNTIKIYL